MTRPAEVFYFEKGRRLLREFGGLEAQAVSAAWRLGLTCPFCSSDQCGQSERPEPPVDGSFCCRVCGRSWQPTMPGA